MHIKILHYIFIYALAEEQYYTFHRRSELIGCGWVYIFQDAYTGVHIKNDIPRSNPRKKQRKIEHILPYSNFLKNFHCMKDASGIKWTYMANWSY
jgi:hypothetical protein